MKLANAEHHLITLFYHIDNFYKVFEEVWEKIIVENKDPSLRWQKTRESSLSLSEMMTIVISFQSLKSRSFKDDYLDHVVTWKHLFLRTYELFLGYLSDETDCYPSFCLSKNFGDIFRWYCLY